MILTNTELEMLARLRAGQHDGCCRQADDDFEKWLKSMILFLAVSGPKFMKFWEDVRGPFVVFNAVSQLAISSSSHRQI